MTDEPLLNDPNVFVNSADSDNPGIPVRSAAGGDVDQARRQTPHARLISAAATLARYQGLAGEDADKVSEATLTRQTSLALTVKNSADALARDHAAVTQERDALRAVIRKVGIMPLASHLFTTAEADAIRAARAALGDTT